MAKRKAKVSAYEIAEQIAAMEPGGEIEVFGPKIVALMKGLPREVFTELDEKYGRFGDRFMGKMWMLRRVRNSEEFGPQMFRGFK